MKVDAHKHCPVCGVPIPLDERVCSPDCEKIITNRIEGSKKSRIFLGIMLLVLVVVWVFMTFIHQG